MCFARTFANLEKIAASIREAMTFGEYHGGCWVIAHVAELMMQKLGLDAETHTLSPDRCMHQPYFWDFGRRARTSLFLTGWWFTRAKLWI